MALGGSLTPIGLAGRKEMTMTRYELEQLNEVRRENRALKRANEDLRNTLLRCICRAVLSSRPHLPSPHEVFKPSRVAVGGR